MRGQRLIAVETMRWGWQKRSSTRPYEQKKFSEQILTTKHQVTHREVERASTRLVRYIFKVHTSYSPNVRVDSASP